MVVATEPQAERIKGMLAKGNVWLAGRVLPDGTLSSEGNTRTGLGQEVGRNGNVKKLAYGSVYRAFYRWYQISKDPTYEALAKQMVQTEARLRAGR